MDTKVCGSFRDIRPALTRHDAIGGTIVATFTSGGDYKVTYRNRFGEIQTLPFLTKFEACTTVSRLKSRGYLANVRSMI